MSWQQGDTYFDDIEEAGNRAEQRIYKQLSEWIEYVESGDMNFESFVDNIKEMMK